MNPILLIQNQDGNSLVRMDLQPNVESAVGASFRSAAQNFTRGIEELIDFDAGYDLQAGEYFRINDFQVGEILEGCLQPLSLDRLQPQAIPNLNIKSVVGYDFSVSDQQRLFFQNFDSRRIIIPGNRLAVFSIPDSATFRELQSPVILLDGPIVAVWDSGTLLFKSFSLVRRIFDLSAYFQEATNERIEQFATHSQFVCADRDAFLNVCTEWYRKKIALLLHDNILDAITPDSLTRAALSVGYTVPMNGQKIQLPTVKSELKALLQFLDEDMYVGAISRRPLLSSGKRSR